MSYKPLNPRRRPLIQQRLKSTFLTGQNIGGGRTLIATGRQKAQLEYPQILNSALVWMDSASIVASGTDVTDWLNKGTGGASYDLSSFTSGTILPQLATFNGVDIVDTTVTPDRNWFSPAALINIPQPYTVMFVGKQDGQPAVQHVAFDAYVAGSRGFIQTVSAGDVQAYSGAVLNGVGGSILVPAVYTMVADGAVNGRVKVNGVVDTTGNIGLTSWDYCTLAQNLNKNNGWDGWLGAFIAFAYALNTQEITDIEDYYKGIYGI